MALQLTSNGFELEAQTPIISILSCPYITCWSWARQPLFSYSTWMVYHQHIAFTKFGGFVTLSFVLISCFIGLCLKNVYKVRLRLV